MYGYRLKKCLKIHARAGQLTGEACTAIKHSALLSMINTDFQQYLLLNEHKTRRPDISREQTNGLVKRPEV